MHFSDFPVVQLKKVFLYGQPETHMRQARHLLLAEQDDAVLAALVDRARRAGGDAARVDAVVADPGQVEEDEPLELVQVGPLLTSSSRSRLGSFAA